MAIPESKLDPSRRVHHVFTGLMMSLRSRAEVPEFVDTGKEASSNAKGIGVREGHRDYSNLQS